jgi:hypothetical protein
MAAHLPLRGAHGAPHFDGTPIHLNRFFADVDLVYTLAGGPGPTAVERITQCKYYLDNDTFMLWDGVEVPPTGFTWDTFKAAIRALYPGCEGGRLYSVRDLERFVADAAARGVYTRGDLGEYYRDFMRMAGHLRRENRIEAGELNRLYIQGFGQITRGKIEQRLQITQPAHHPEDPYPMAQVQEAATFLLSHTSPTSPGTAFSNSPGPPTFAADGRAASLFGATPSNPQQQVKREVWDMESFMTGIGKIIAENMAQHAGAYRPPNAPNTNFAGAGPRPNGCHFCGALTCRIATCPTVEEYRRAGKCIRNEQGRVCLPSGRFIPGHIQGATLKERFDNFLAANPTPQVPTVSTMMFESVEAFITEENPDAGDDPQLDDGDLEVLHRVLANEMAKKGKKPAPRSKPIVEIRSNKTNAVPPVPRPTAPTPPKVADAIPRAPKPDAQFKFQSPLENPTITQSVLDKALDVSITLSQRELLAVSPDLRRKLKDLTTGRRVPTTMTEVLISDKYFERDDPVAETYATDTTSLIVAEESLPLRAFSGLLDKRTPAECVIDNGSSIVAVRRDIWEKLGTALCANSVLNMQSSNSSLAATAGLLRDFPLTVGPATFYLQIQVADNLPCEVLLGRPFFTLTRALTIDHDDGSMDIELNDPNTGQRIRVPTHEKRNLRRSDF